MGYPDKPSSPRGSLSIRVKQNIIFKSLLINKIILSVLAVHMELHGDLWDNMSAAEVKATEQEHYDMSSQEIMARSEQAAN